MLAKGQISFDVFFAVIFMLVFAQQLTVISMQFNESSRQNSILAQEKAIGNSIAAIINSAQALSDGKFSIEYVAPRIFETEATGTKNCDITIAAAEISVSHPDKTSANKIEATIAFQKPASFSVGSSPSDNIPATAKCGEIIAIKKVV